MTGHAPDPRRTAASRDAAITRLRRGTGIVAGACVALTATFAGLAAGFTTGRHAVTTVRSVRHATAAPVVAPAPRLVQVGPGAASSASSSASQSGSPVSAPPPAAAPVVVSGGS